MELRLCDEGRERARCFRLNEFEWNFLRPHLQPTSEFLAQQQEPGLLISHLPSPDFHLLHRWIVTGQYPVPESREAFRREAARWGVNLPRDFAWVSSPNPLSLQLVVCSRTVLCASADRLICLSHNAICILRRSENWKPIQLHLPVHFNHAFDFRLAGPRGEWVLFSYCCPSTRAFSFYFRSDDGVVDGEWRRLNLSAVSSARLVTALSFPKFFLVSCLTFEAHPSKVLFTFHSPSATDLPVPWCPKSLPDHPVTCDSTWWSIFLPEGETPSIACYSCDDPSSPCVQFRLPLQIRNQLSQPRSSSTRVVLGSDTRSPPHFACVATAAGTKIHLSLMRFDPSHAAAGIELIWEHSLETPAILPFSRTTPLSHGVLTHFRLALHFTASFFWVLLWSKCPLQSEEQRSFVRVFLIPRFSSPTNVCDVLDVADFPGLLMSSLWVREISLIETPSGPALAFLFHNGTLAHFEAKRNAQ